MKLTILQLGQLSHGFQQLASEQKVSKFRVSALAQLASVRTMRLAQAVFASEISSVQEQLKAQVSSKQITPEKAEQEMNRVMSVIVDVDVPKLKLSDIVVDGADVSLDTLNKLAEIIED